jgi:hypothetical protein
MNTRTVLTVGAVVFLLYGLATLFVSSIINPLYGFGTTASELLLTRFLGGALLGLGLINWLAKDQDYSTLHPIFIGNLITDVVGLILALTGTLAGTLSAVGWVSVVLWLVLSLAFAYLQFMGQSVSMRQRA